MDYFDELRWSQNGKKISSSLQFFVFLLIDDDYSQFNKKKKWQTYRAGEIKGRKKGKEHIRRVCSLSLWTGQSGGLKLQELSWVGANVREWPRLWLRVTEYIVHWLFPCIFYSLFLVIFISPGIFESDRCRASFLTSSFWNDLLRRPHARFFTKAGPREKKRVIRPCDDSKLIPEKKGVKKVQRYCFNPFSLVSRSSPRRWTGSKGMCVPSSGVSLPTDFWRVLLSRDKMEDGERVIVNPAAFAQWSPSQSFGKSAGMGLAALLAPLLCSLKMRSPRQRRRWLSHLYGH